MWVGGGIFWVGGDRWTFLWMSGDEWRYIFGGWGWTDNSYGKVGVVGVIGGTFG